MSKEKRKNKKKRRSPIKLFLFSLIALTFLSIFFIWKFPPREIKEPRQIMRFPMPKLTSPAVALIIDDGGYNIENIKEILALGKPITYAILPYAPYTQEVALLAYHKGNEVILHLPMEPKEKEGLPVEKIMLRNGMPPERIKMIIQNALRQVPHARGINNHMGSKATEDPRIMKVLMNVLKEEGMFYVDSGTSPNSVGPELAQENGVPFARNDRFIDHDKDVTSIKQAIRQSLKKAQKKGKVVLIGHPYPETKQAIQEIIPEIEKLGMRFVFASEVVE